MTLAVMARALPRRSLRCRAENRTETIEGCSRVSRGVVECGLGPDGIGRQGWRRVASIAASCR